MRKDTFRKAEGRSEKVEGGKQLRCNLSVHATRNSQLATRQLATRNSQLDYKMQDLPRSLSPYLDKIQATQRAYISIEVARKPSA